MQICTESLVRMAVAAFVGAVSFGGVWLGMGHVIAFFQDANRAWAQHMARERAAGRVVERTPEWEASRVQLVALITGGRQVVSWLAIACLVSLPTLLVLLWRSAACL